jgi:multidrug resistance efflux pump
MTEHTQPDTEEVMEQTQIHTEKKTEQAKIETPPQEKPPLNMVRIWTFFVIGICMVLLVWYLRADRITPYTSQARVNSMVVPIASEVSGSIISVAVKNNQRVKAGQELFQIDKHHYKLSLQIAKAEYETARQSTAAAAASVEEAKASLGSNNANLKRAKQDAVRMQNIRNKDSGAISIRRLEVSEASLAMAQGNVAMAKAKLKRARENLGRVGKNNSRLLQAQAKLDHAKHDLDLTVIRAPANGFVSGVRLEKGNFASKGAPLMTFIATENYWVRAAFTENNLGHLREGNTVEMVFDAFPGKIFTGTIREMGFGVAVDETPFGALPTIKNSRAWLRAAQRFPVLIDFTMESDEADRVLKVGSQVTVIAYTGNNEIFNNLAGFYIRLVSILTYAY